MAISVFDLFSVGIGPSSSHTVGPMRAARAFVGELQSRGELARVAALRTELYGSLALTGRGHGTDKAVVLGLEGEQPETVDVDRAHSRVEQVRNAGRLWLAHAHEVRFDECEHLLFHRNETLSYHPNGMRFTALDSDGAPFHTGTFYSVGGGFVVDERAAAADVFAEDEVSLPYPFASAEELLDHCHGHGLSVAELMLRNESVWRPTAAVREELLELWRVMRECVARGCERPGTLPSGLGVERRAPKWYRELSTAHDPCGDESLRAMDWVNLWAIAVNEENAAGGRLVTAPTNGAAGIIPAILHYYDRFVPDADADGIVRFLLTAGAIGILYKTNASISGAEVGCQGEVGSACSMAAGGLTEVLGGTPPQVENAAEIAMEHNLGLTCDPIGGLVQIPCIERNAMAAVKAINAARMALHGDGSHFVSLDKVIATMRETGADMATKYKETARGGLAVNVPVSVIEC